MAGAASYPIEDFLEAITGQLDETQDKLGLKAVNRPLTFAIKDFAIDLSVFIDVVPEGRIRVRPSGPNESGASVVKIGLTTITRPMIEENTVSLELTRSPGLDEVGLAPEERQRLARLGVRNAAQLRRLGARAGDDTLSRLSGVSVDRLRSALNLGRPQVDGVVADEPRDAPAGRPVAHRGGNGETMPPSREEPPVRIAPDARRLRLSGRNLIEGGRPPVARLNDRILPVAQASSDAIVVELPPNPISGTLEIETSDGAVSRRRIEIEPATRGGQAPQVDPWLPEAP